MMKKIWWFPFLLALTLVTATIPAAAQPGDAAPADTLIRSGFLVGPNVSLNWYLSSEYGESRGMKNYRFKGGIRFGDGEKKLNRFGIIVLLCPEGHWWDSSVQGDVAHGAMGAGVECLLGYDLPGPFVLEVGGNIVGYLEHWEYKHYLFDGTNTLVYDYVEQSGFALYQGNVRLYTQLFHLLRIGLVAGLEVDSFRWHYQDPIRPMIGAEMVLGNF